TAHTTVGTSILTLPPIDQITFLSCARARLGTGIPTLFLVSCCLQPPTCRGADESRRSPAKKQAIYFPLRRQLLHRAAGRRPCSGPISLGQRGTAVPRLFRRHPDGERRALESQSHGQDQAADRPLAAFL